MAECVQQRAGRGSRPTAQIHQASGAGADPGGQRVSGHSQLAVVAGIQRDHQVIARRRLVERRRDPVVMDAVLLSFSGHDRGSVDHARRPRAGPRLARRRSLIIVSWPDRDHDWLELRSWRASPRRQSKIARVTIANAKPKSSIGMSHGARSPDISTES